MGGCSPCLHGLSSIYRLITGGRRGVASSLFLSRREISVLPWLHAGEFDVPIISVLYSLYSRLNEETTYMNRDGKTMKRRNAIDQRNKTTVEERNGKKGKGDGSEWTMDHLERRGQRSENAMGWYA